MPALPTLQLQKWSDLQEEHLSRGNILLEMPSLDGWYIFMAADHYEQIEREYKGGLYPTDPYYTTKPKGVEQWAGFLSRIIVIVPIAV